MALDENFPHTSTSEPLAQLASEIETLYAAGAAADREQARPVFVRLRAALSAGEARAAEPDGSAPDGWRVNAWVKQGILLGFKFGVVVDVSADHGRWPFFDKDTLPLKSIVDDGIALGGCESIKTVLVYERTKTPWKRVEQKDAKAPKLIKLPKSAMA